MAASRWGALLIAGLALGAGGCTQTTTQALSEPVATTPMVLGSAPGSTAAATSLAPATTASGQPDAVAATTPVAPAPVAPQPVAVAPAPAAPQPVAASAEPEPLPTPPAAATGGEFPNINKVPPQPGGTLLPEAERARIIAELEALRARQDTVGGSGGSGGGGPDLATQAETHGQAAIRQIEACSQDGALENNPDCAPAD